MAADCRRELGSWNTGLVGQPPSPCSGELPKSADEAHGGHLFSRLVQGISLKKAGASLGRMARPIRRLSRTVKRAGQTILAMGDGGFASLHRIGGGSGRRCGQASALHLGSWDHWHSHEMPIRLSRMSHPWRSVSRTIRGGWRVRGRVVPCVPAIDASFLRRGKHNFAL
jgi:hypothetical protein